MSSPEQLTKQSVSTASDVWSYGCVLVELYGRGKPFPGLSNYQAAQAVMAGGCATAPASAPADVAAAIGLAFTRDAETRPVMKDLVATLVPQG